MIVEGTSDKTLPPGDHVRPLTDAKTDGELHLITIDGAGHGSLVHRKRPEMDDAIDRFLASLSTEMPD